MIDPSPSLLCREPCKRTGTLMGHCYNVMGTLALGYRGWVSCSRTGTLAVGQRGRNQGWILMTLPGVCAQVGAGWGLQFL